MKNRPAARGVTMIMAVGVIGLIAITMAMLLTLRTNDFKRLAAERESAQADQVRLAMVATAHAQLAAGKLVNGPVALPDGFGTATINWTETTATITIDQTQTAVAFEKTPAGWMVWAQ